VIQPKTSYAQPRLGPPRARCQRGDQARRQGSQFAREPRRSFGAVAPALVALGIAFWPTIASAGAYGTKRPHATKRHSTATRVTDGVYRGKVPHPGPLGSGPGGETVSAAVHIVKGKVVELDTVGAPFCVQNEPGTTNSNYVGGMTSFKVRVQPPVPVRPGKLVGVFAGPGAGPGAPPIPLPGPPVPLSNIIEANYPGGPGLPLTGATLGWFLTYSPLAVRLPVTPPRIGHRILLYLGGFSVSFGDPSNGGVACDRVLGYLRIPVGIPPLVTNRPSSRPPGRPPR
jgi:hypothetical protein